MTYKRIARVNLVNHDWTLERPDKEFDYITLVTHAWASAALPVDIEFHLHSYPSDKFPVEPLHTLDTSSKSWEYFGIKTVDELL